MMTATLYLRPSPRAYFLITETHALIFRQPHASESKASRSVVVAEFKPMEEVDTRGLIRAGRAGLGVEGVLGVTSVPSGMFNFASRSRLRGGLRLGYDPSADQHCSMNGLL